MGKTSSAGRSAAASLKFPPRPSVNCDDIVIPISRKQTKNTRKCQNKLSGAAQLQKVKDFYDEAPELLLTAQQPVVISTATAVIAQRQPPVYAMNRNMFDVLAERSKSDMKAGWESIDLSEVEGGISDEWETLEDPSACDWQLVEGHELVTFKDKLLGKNNNNRQSSSGPGVSKHRSPEIRPVKATKLVASPEEEAEDSTSTCTLSDQENDRFMEMMQNNRTFTGRSKSNNKDRKAKRKGR